MNIKVDVFIRKAKKWQDEMTELRNIVLSCGFNEELKWHQPCYTYQGSNIVIISGFKNYCALNFLKGSLLKDTYGIMVKPGENTQTGRQIRFTSISEISRMKKVLKEYLFETIEAEKAGIKVKLKKTEDYKMPEELKVKLKTDPVFKKAFYALTPGRQRGYILHFSAPKLSQTRTSRIAKSTPDILKGKGIHDR